jgi:hypothetical protein
MFTARTWVPALFTLPVLMFALPALIRTTGELTSPCNEWDYSSDRGYSSHTPDDPCRQRIFHSGTRAGATVSMLAVPGVITFAAGLGIWAAARRRRRMAWLAACLMLAEAFPLALGFWGMLLALLAGTGFLYAAVSR